MSVRVCPCTRRTPGVTSEFDVPTGDPVQVARDGVAEARAKLHDVVIVDTAGVWVLTLSSCSRHVTFVTLLSRTKFCSLSMR